MDGDVLLCGVCDLGEATSYVRFAFSDYKMYFCRSCMEKREAEIKKMLKENDVSLARTAKEYGIDLVDDCEICGKKLNRNRQFRIFPNLCDICNHQVIDRRICERNRAEEEAG